MANASTHLKGKLTIAGEEISSDWVFDLVVDRDLDHPDMLAVTLSNHPVVYSDKLKEGDDVTLELGVSGETSELVKIFTGEVTGIEPVYDVRQPMRVVVRALNQMYRLGRCKEHETFTDRTDEDIAKKICGDNGLTLKFEGPKPGPKHKHVYQADQTDYEFLKERAARLGCTISVEETELRFAKRTDEVSDVELHLGSEGAEGLSRFSPRLSTLGQVAEVKVTGWNPDTKERFIGSAKPEDSKLGDKTGAAIVEAVHKVVLDINTGVSVGTKDEADAIAKAVLSDRMMSFISGDGTTAGNPKIKPGTIITLHLPDKRFSGKYYVTSVRHRYVHEGAAAGYVTDFRVRRDARNLAEGE